MQNIDGVVCMRLPRPGSGRTWLLAGLWLVAIAFAAVVGANDASPGVLAKASTGIAVLSGLAALLSLAGDVLARGPGNGPSTPTPVEPVTAAGDADRLAEAVQSAWSDEFEIRRVRLPLFSRMLPVRWDPADADLASPADVVSPSPLIGAEVGMSSGTVENLVELYQALPHSHLVVLGAPGSGKSVALAQLTLGLLARRNPGDPVPVPMQMESWDTNRTTFRAWLVRQLIENYSLGAGRRRPSATVARELVAAGLILPVLDGLDEIHENLRPMAILEINEWIRPGRPVILSCRTDDYRNVVQRINVIYQSHAVLLRPLKAAAAHEYLRSAAPGGGAQKVWESINSDVRLHPEGPLAKALQSPLMVGLVREIYCDGPGDPKELLDHRRFPTQDAIESHLLDRLVPASYRRTSVRDDDQREQLLEWPAGRPQEWLRYLAAGAENSAPNIAWWLLERGMSPLVTGVLPIAIAGILVTRYLGLAAILVFAVAALAACTSWAGRGWTLEALLLGRHADLPRRQRTARWLALTAGRVAGAVAGVAYGYYIYYVKHYAPVYPSAAKAVMVGLAVGVADGFFTISLRSTPTQTRVAPYRGITAFLRRFLIYLVMGTAATATVWVLFHSPYVILVISVVFVIFGLVDSINVWLDVPTDVTSALDPRSTRRAERFAAIARSILIASTLAAVTMGLYWIAGTPDDGITPAVIVGSVYGLTDRLMGLTTSVWGRYIVANAWAALRGDLPWRLMTFLEDAHHRGVLRRAGAVYQFRHARLQQHLAPRPETDQP